MNSRRWMLQQETSDGRWLSVGMAERAAEDDDRRRRRLGLIPERVDSSTLASYRAVLDMP